MKSQHLIKVVVLFALGIFFCAGGFSTVEAGPDKAYLRMAAGKYKGDVNGSAVAFGTTLPFTATGSIKMPPGKGKGKIALVSNGQTISLNIKVKKARVKQGGKKIVYKGTSAVPATLTQGFGEFGDLGGPFRATVILGRKSTLTATSTVNSAAGVSVTAEFKGKK